MAIRKRRNGVYFLDITLRDGRRVRESLKTSDKAIARIRGTIRGREIAGAEETRAPRIEDFVREYLAFAETRKARGTLLGDRVVLKRLTKEFPGARLSDISARHADQFIASLIREVDTKGTLSRSAAGVNWYVRCLRSIFETARRWKYIDENPWREVRELKVEIEIPRVLTQKEVAAIMTTARHHYPDLIGVFHFALYTGLRRSEILRLEWDSVDLERGVLLIRKTKAKRPRIVPILPQARLILEERKVFPRPFQFPPKRVSEGFTDCAKRSGLKDVTFHDLRRTFASTLLGKGVPRDIVQKIAGWSDFATLDSFYFGLPEDVIRRLSAMDFSDVHSN